jgi:PAS domain S-box-containing protein
VARTSAIALGLYALLGGLISFLGWALDMPRLTDWDNDGISIQPNATVAAVVAGLALILHTRGYRRTTMVAAAIVAFIGGSVLFQSATQVDLRIDGLFLFGRTWGGVGVLYPGRMGPPGATSWTVLGLALLCASGTFGHRARPVAPVLAGVTTLVASLSIIGYLYQASPLYSLPTLTIIALQTSTFILAISIGLLLALPDLLPTRVLLEDSPAGVLVRRILPAVVVVPILVGFIRVLGERAGLYETNFGSAARTLVEIALLLALLAWTVTAIRRHSRAQQTAEASAIEQAERVTNILESITGGFITLDQEMRFTYVNREAERLLGRTRDELTGRRVWDLFPEDETTNAGRELKRAAATRTGVEFEDYSAALGRWFRNRVSPTADGGLSVYFEDITARKRDEASLREADRRKNEFLAVLAHELRNPLAPVRNAAAVLARTRPDDPDLAQAAGIVERQIALMGRLLDDLLDVGRIASDRLELRRQPTPLSRAIRAAVEMCAPIMADMNHQLAVRLPDEEVYLDADPARLGQIFGNLLNNACKYGQPNGRLTIEAKQHGAQAVVTVTDNGIGIPTDKLDSIFALFAQVDRGFDRPTSGLGIGLHLVKRLVEMHGGTIEARSEGPGTGSRFIVRLPTLATATPLERPPEGAPGFRPKAAARQRRILIVDDNVDSAQTLARLLRLQGHEPYTVHDGLEAVTAAAQLRPDVVLMDLGLPSLSGLEACRRIRREPWGENLVIFALTGWGQDADRRRTGDAGFDQHLVKPVDPRVLMSLIERERTLP